MIPDEWKDYPHHYGKDGLIRHNVIESRKCWLKGDKENSGFRLGVAFHYIADKWTLMSGNDPRHSSWEQSIARSRISNDNIRQLVQFSGLPDYYPLIEKLEKEPVGKEETTQIARLCRPSISSVPSVDLNIAFKICQRVAQSVFSPLHVPMEIREKIDAAGIMINSVVSRTHFRFLWCLFLLLIFLGMIPLFSINTVFFLTAFLATFSIEIYSLKLLRLKELKPYNKIRELGHLATAWFIMMLVFVVLSGYAGLILMSENVLSKVAILAVVSSLFGQNWMLWHLVKKTEANKLYTYIEWFTDLEPPLQVEKPTQSKPNNTEGESSFDLDDNILRIERCPYCGRKYTSDGLTENCPNCGAKAPYFTLDFHYHIS